MSQSLSSSPMSDTSNPSTRMQTSPIVFRTVEALEAHLRSLDVPSEDASIRSTMYTELDHGLQTAALLRASHPDDVELQVAGLIHDVAHPWDGAGQPRHGDLGAEAVRPLLGLRVARLVRLHVDAKRYLITTDPEYAHVLSKGSVATLAAQGGAMSDSERESFEQNLDWEQALALRRADDGAKVPGASVPSLADWLPAIEWIAKRQL